MNTFAITIQRKAETGWPIVVELGEEKTPLVVRYEGVLELDLITLQSKGTPRDYGMLLGQALFRDAIREAFLQARAESEDHLSALLFVEDPELRNLHWERLCAPLDLDDRWDFLALDQRAPLTLSVPSGTHRFFRQIGQRDLRALVVVASPQGLQRYQLAPFDVETVVANVRTALGGIPCDVLAATPNAVGPPTLDEFCARLTMAPYTLLHIVCHGRHFPDSGETVLYLADEHNQVEPVEGSRLLERLREGCALPHFVFLATCESASPQAEGALGGLAQRLVRELGLPAVLAMTEQVSITTAQALASQFYPQLLQAHGYLGVALVEACAGLAERPDVTVPVLYSRLGAHPLFEQQVTLSTTSLDQRDRVNLIKALSRAYREALESSLQGVAEIALTLSEQLDLPQAPQPASRKQPHKERLLPEGTSILDVYDETSTGLLILGAPGAGKSTLLYNLAHALLTRAAQEENHPLPVVLNLSLWATKRLPFEDWIVEQLELRYYVPRKLGQHWQQEGRWLLLLDGLNEVAPSARVACVEAINTYLTTRTHLVSIVVCSRLEEYETLAKPLALQRVVVVQPLTPEQVATYLNKAGRSLTAVREVVRSNPVLNESLTTPLMLNVAALAYQDKAVEDLPQIGTADEQQRHIFASYLQHMLPAAEKQSSLSARKMLHYLVWLAQQMRQRSQSILYLEHLQPDWLPSRWAQQVYSWLGVWLPDILIGGLVSFVIHLLFFFSGTDFDLLTSFLLGGVVGGLLCSTPAALSAVTPLRTRRPLLSLLATAGLLGLGVGLGLALLSLSDPFHSLNPTITGMSFGLVTALLTLLIARWPPASQQAPSLAVNGTGTRRRFWRQGLLIGGLFGLSYGLCDGLLIGQFWGLNYGLAWGLSDGLSYGLAWGLCGVSISLLLVHRPKTIVPTEILVWSWKRLWRSLKQGEHMRETLMLALMIGLRVGLVGGLSNGLQNGLSSGLAGGLQNLLSSGLVGGLSYGLSVAGSYWLLVGLFQGISSTTFRERQRTTPNQGTHRSGRNGLFLGLPAGSIAAVIGGGGVLMSYMLSYAMSYALLIGLNEGLLIGLNEGLLTGLNEALSRGCQIGLAVGLLVILLMGGLAWWRHWLLRFLLWRSGTIPWRYVPFLDEAAQQILLRKVGGGYRFIHDLFRDYLVTLEAPEPGGSVVQGVRDDD